MRSGELPVGLPRTGLVVTGSLLGAPGVGSRVWGMPSYKPKLLPSGAWPSCQDKLLISSLFQYRLTTSAPPSLKGTDGLGGLVSSLSAAAITMYCWGAREMLGNRIWALL